jgi:APA family basic amino acid/polyamine antiporter
MERVKVGFNTAYSVVVANMIGVGVFTSLGFQLIDLHSYITIIVLWLFGGFLALNGSFCYAELSAAYPKSGGEYNFLRQAFGNQVGFLSGWTSSIVGFAAPIAAAAHAFSKYFIDLSHLTINPLYISIPLILIITTVHCISLSHSSKLQIFTSFSKILLLILFIVFGFISVYFFEKGVPPTAIGNQFLVLGDFKTEILSPAFWVGLIYVSYAYSGWNASSYIIDDIKNPKKVVPRSILWGVLTVIVIYTLLNLVFVLSSAPAEMIGKEDFVFNVAHNLFTKNGAILISSLISFFLISSISALIMVGPRVIHTISQDYPFFSFFAKSNTKGAPYRSIITQAIISIVILATSSFEFIISTMGLILCFFTTLTAVSLMVLRYKHPNIERPIKAPFYPLPPILYAVFNIWIMYHVVTSKPNEAIYSFIFLILGAIIYFMAKSNKNKINTTLIAVGIMVLLGACAGNNNQNNTNNSTTDTLQQADTLSHVSKFKDNVFDTRATKIAGLDTSNMTDSKRTIFNNLNTDWNRHYEKTLAPMSTWVKSEVAPYLNKEHYSVFYPFSGPDIAFAGILYDNADNYILVGLEKAVSKESFIFSENNIDNFLAKTPEIFFYTSRLGFFRTKDMHRQFQDKGLADVIIFYLKRINCKITNAKMGVWNATTGEIDEVTNGATPNVFIADFELPNHKQSHIYYFSKDLSDEQMKKDPKFFEWVAKKDNNMYSFNKAASYLMHSANFSTIRSFLVSNSKFHIQDDTGVPYKYFVEASKKVTLYGVYNRLINLFEYAFQPDLKKSYDNLEKRPLPFSLGYNSAHGESNLQIARNE